ncbi:MAG: DUF3313 domain-containing protein [Gammaproteobacteria bacterium]
MTKAVQKYGLIFLVSLLVAVCAGCTSQQVKPSRSETPPGYSGFLSDYSVLKPDPSDPDYARYIAPGVQLQQYRKFIVDAPVIIVNTGDKFQPLDPARLMKITDYYQERLMAALSRHYQVVTTPGPGVARLRVAVVGVVEVKPALKPRDFIPLTALFNLGRMAVDMDPYVLRVSIESEAVDAQTGRVLGETVDSRETVKTVTRGEQPAPAQLHDLIDFWVARFVARLDKVNGYAPPK